MYPCTTQTKSQAPTNEFFHPALLRELLKSLDIARVHLIGNSLGSVIATEFALEYPEMTTALVLDGPAVNGFQASQESMERGYVPYEIARSQGAQRAAEAMLADPSSAPAMENPLARDRVRQITLENADRFNRNIPVARDMFSLTTSGCPDRRLDRSQCVNCFGKISPAFGCNQPGLGNISSLRTCGAGA